MFKMHRNPESWRNRGWPRSNNAEERPVSASSVESYESLQKGAVELERIGDGGEERREESVAVTEEQPVKKVRFPEAVLSEGPFSRKDAR